VNWIDERIKERKIKEEKESLVYGHAEEVFDALWEHVSHIIGEARSKGLGVGTNGGPRNRIAYASVIPKRGQTVGERKELNLTLDQNRRGITARVGGTTLKFVVAANDSNMVGLQYDGEEVQIENVAIMLADRIIFYDLPPANFGPPPLSPEEEEAMRRMEHNMEKE
jgi:hypothetical protein